jgi:hypothetical protein
MRQILLSAARNEREVFAGRRVDGWCVAKMAEVAVPVDEGQAIPTTAA